MAHPNARKVGGMFHGQSVLGGRGGLKNLDSRKHMSGVGKLLDEGARKRRAAADKRRSPLPKAVPTGKKAPSFKRIGAKKVQPQQKRGLKSGKK